MATIDKRTLKSGVSYRVRIRMRGHETIMASFKRLADAKEWAAGIETAIREGRYFQDREAERHTLAEAVERYNRAVMVHKPKSARVQRPQLEWWSGCLGHRLLSEISASMIAECRERLAENMSSATVNRYLAPLSHLFNVAVKEWGWLDHSPMEGVKKLKEPRGRVRFLQPDELSRLITECKPHPTLHTAVMLALSTGSRQGEMMRIRWQDIDFQRAIVTFHETKNGERRSVPVAKEALALLVERSRVRMLNNDLVFASLRRPGKSIDLRRPFTEALERAQIDDFRWHDLRHSCASYLAMSGATLAEIADVLGHKTLDMVKRYAHLSQQHTAGVVGRMSSKFLCGI